MKNPYSVKNVKTFTGREGYGMNASLYKDGKRLGMVRDMANGGEFDYDFDWKHVEELEEFANKYLKEHPVIFNGKPMDYGGRDVFVDQMIEEFEIEKQHRSWCRKNIVFRLKGDPQDSWRTMKGPASPTMHDYVQRHYPNLEEILNDRYAS